MDQELRWPSCLMPCIKKDHHPCHVPLLPLSATASGSQQGWNSHKKCRYAGNLSDEIEGVRLDCLTMQHSYLLLSTQLKQKPELLKAFLPLFKVRLICYWAKTEKS